MIFYSITYIMNMAAAFAKRDQKRILNVLVMLFLIFMSGTRYYMGGSDVYVYENFYKTVPSVPVVLQYVFTGVNHGVNENYEWGFSLIASVIKMLRFNYFGFTLLYSILFYALMYKGLKKYAANWQILIAVFMYKMMFYDTFISIRQGMTMAIFFIAIQYMEEGKWLRYFILALVATCVHRGAILLFLVYFLRFVPVTKKGLTWYAVLFAPTYLIRGAVDISGILNRVISIIGYEQKSQGWTEATEAISIIHTIECYIIVIMVIIFFEKIKKVHPSLAS